MKNYKNYAIKVIEHTFMNQWETDLLDSYKTERIADSMTDKILDILYDLYESYDYTSMEKDINNIYMALCNFSTDYYYSKLELYNYDHLKSYDIDFMIDNLYDCFEKAREIACYEIETSNFISQFEI